MTLTEKFSDTNFSKEDAGYLQILKDEYNTFQELRSNMERLRVLLTNDGEWTEHYNKQGSTLEGTREVTYGINSDGTITRSYSFCPTHPTEGVVTDRTVNSYENGELSLIDVYSQNITTLSGETNKSPIVEISYEFDGRNVTNFSATALTDKIIKDK